MISTTIVRKFYKISQFVSLLLMKSKDRQFCHSTEGMNLN
ncbi:MAG: hypothetical protein TRG1_2984 [Flavobacteriaceae bacterium FS1-H7996/R]|nr:MAG: hypothetical protein TRG1_2984 [Flavobacteriaceae bacterium FS1-H7996/R]